MEALTNKKQPIIEHKTGLKMRKGENGKTTGGQIGQIKIGESGKVYASVCQCFCEHDRAFMIMLLQLSYTVVSM